MIEFIPIKDIISMIIQRKFEVCRKIDIIVMCEPPLFPAIVFSNDKKIILCYTFLVFYS